MHISVFLSEKLLNKGTFQDNSRTLSYFQISKNAFPGLVVFQGLCSQKNKSKLNENKETKNNTRIFFCIFMYFQRQGKLILYMIPIYNEKKQKQLKMC